LAKKPLAIAFLTLAIAACGGDDSSGPSAGSQVGFINDPGAAPAPAPAPAQGGTISDPNTQPENSDESDSSATVRTVSVDTDQGLLGQGRIVDSTVAFVGQASANSTVEIYVDGAMSGSVLSTADGNWRFDYTYVTLTPATYRVRAVSTSGSGATLGVAGDFVFTYDPTAPAAPVIVELVNDTGLGNDGITSNPQLLLSGTSEPDVEITLLLDDVEVGTSTADSSGNWQFDYSGISLPDGTYQWTAEASILGLTSAISSQYPVTVDTVAPATGTIGGITPDTGVSNSDNLTNASTFSLFGTAEPGSAVDVLQGGTVVATAVADGAGNWTSSAVSGSSANGTFSYTVTVSDVAGNGSGPASPISVVKDTAAPSSVNSIAISDDTGPVSSDRVTSDTTPTYTGTAEAGSQVDVLLDGALLGSATADTGGNWTLSPAGSPLADGSYTLTATVTDNAGNQSASSPDFSLIVDSAAPAAPVVSAIASDTGLPGDGVTADQTLLISGSAEPDAVVEVLVNSGLIGTVTADGSGSWIFDYTGTTINQGSYTLTATATDLAGNVSGPSAGFALEVDLSAPASPIIAAVSNDTGTPGDGITADQTLIISGTAEASTTLDLFLGGASIGSTTVDGSGNWAIDYTGTTLIEGVYSLTATATDAAGNVSPVSSGFDLEIDLTNPAAPVIAAVTDDTGVAGDGITSDQNLVISGTAETGSVVEVVVDGAPAGTTTADGSGNWAFDYTGTSLLEGSYTLTATATDGAGNLSAASTGFALEIDRTAPTAPTIGGIADDTGTAGDGITNDQTLVISGTAEADSIVEVLVGGTSAGTISADGSGNWVFDYTGTPLNQGSYVLTATATDSAGNTSAASAGFALEIDLTAPAAPAVTGVTDDTGTAGDGITSDQTLIISGTAEADSTVDVLVNGVSAGAATADGSGNWTFDYTGTPLNQGSYVLTATATDGAGNTSAASPDFALEIDLTAPAAPTVAGITDDTGTAGDGITSDQTLIISGTAEAGSIVDVLVDGVSVGTTTADGSGNWTSDYTGTALNAGSYVLTAIATDVAGNTSAASAGFALEIDLTAPVAPVVTGVTDDTGTAGDGITSDQTLIISGTAEAGAIVDVLVDGGSAGTTTADGSGNWTFDYTGTTLPEGSYVLTATATDGAGNTSAGSASFALVIDQTAPAAPTVTGVADDTGTAGDGITSDQTLLISGTAEPGSIVDVLVDGISAGTTTADGSGNWTFDNTGTTLPAGSYALTATATDGAGNTSADSASFALVIDQTAPAAPTVAGITNDTGTAGDGITSDQTLIISGTSEAEAIVDVLVDGGSVGTTTADGSGNWTFDYTGTALNQGSYVLTATATDNAGNTSAASAGFALEIDLTAPNAPAVTGVTDDTGTPGDGVTNDQTLFIDGTSEADASVELFINSVSVGTTTADGSGNWTYDYTGTSLGAGTYTLSAQATDAAGLASPVSAGFTLEIDLTAPAAPTITALADDTGSLGDGVTSDQTLIFSGTAEADSTVNVYLDGVLLGTAPAAGGSWAYDHTAVTLSEANYVLTAEAVDIAGNVSALSADFAFEVDASAPAVPVVSGVTDDTATAGDGITSDNSLIIDGTGPAGETVEIFLDGSSIGTASVAGGGAWSYDYTASPLTDGSYTITAESFDAAGNRSAASAGFALTVDTTAPVVTATVPSNNATDVPTNASRSITFDQVVERGTGNFTLLDDTDTVIETINVADPEITGYGTSTLTITPTAPLQPSSVYYINISPGAVLDEAGNSFAGINDDASWTFTSEDFALIDTIPADNATDVALNTSLGFVFNSSAFAGTGAVRVRQASDDTLIDTLDLQVVSVAGEGSDTLTLALSDNLAPNTEFYVEADATAFETSDGVNFGGLADPTAFSFTTVNVPVPAVTNVTSSTADGTYANGSPIVIQVTFDNNVTVTGNPYLLMDLDGTDRTAAYSAGSGSNTLEFIYTVAPGDSSSDLGYVASDSLKRSGGSIRSDQGANADLTLPAPGAAGSLRNNKAIVIASNTLNAGALAADEGFLVLGNTTTDYFPRSLRGGGDFNGDGFEDFIIGDNLADASAGDSGAAWVVFGKPGATRADFDIDAGAADDGFKIVGPTKADYLGMTVDLSGDLNGDGYDDAVVVASYSDDSQPDAGMVWVIWGKAGATHPDVNVAPGNFSSSDGFRVVPFETSDLFQSTIAYIPENAQFLDADGDFNGDGIDDLVLGHPTSDLDDANSGVVYVVLGKPGATRADVQLNALGTEGFRIRLGEADTAQLGHSVQYLNDFNGDHVNDLIIGAHRSNRGATNGGEAIIVFGTPGATADIDLSLLSNTQGFRVDTTIVDSYLGGSVASGDVNGDGLTDALIGHVASNTANGADSGAVQVIYGRQAATYSDLQVGSIPTSQGFYVLGKDVGDFMAYALESLGDVDGDGVDDFLTSTWYNDDSAGDAGAGWIIRGVSGTSRATVDLVNLGSNDGIEVVGGGSADYLGRTNSLADVNGDGYVDALLGAPNGQGVTVDDGHIAVIWGSALSSADVGVTTGSASADRLIGTSGDDTLSGGGGADSLQTGAGTDRLIIGDLSFLRVDGGRGVDTLELNVSQATLDLVTLPADRIRGIERIDLGSSGNGLNLDKAGLLSLSDEVRSLYVLGDASDWVSTVETWTENGTVIDSGVTFVRYDLGLASLYVQETVGQPKAPPAPVVTGISQDTGTAGDGITSDTTLRYLGTSNPHDSIEVFADGSSLGVVDANASGNWSLDRTATPVGEGDYSITAVATNGGGYSSATSAAFALTVKTTTPAPVVLDFADDTANSSDNITGDNTLIFNGTAGPNVSVEVFLNGGIIGSQNSDGSGNWVFDHSGTVLGDGPYSVTAQATDAAGNTATSAVSLDLIIDTTISTPVVTGISDDTGTPGDAVTGDNTLTFFGTSDPNDVVAVSRDGSVLGSVSADGSGNWSYTDGTTLADGTYQVTAQASDVAGNLSAVSAQLTVVVDSSEPVINSLSPADNATGVTSTANLQIVFDEAVTPVTGNITIRRSSDNSVFEQIPVGDARVTGSGTSTITIDPTLSFEALTDYYVLVDSGAFENTLERPFAGISAPADWNFTSENIVLLNSSSPADNAINVAPDATIALTFNQPVSVSGGNLRIRRSGDDSLYDTVSLTSGQVSGAGTATLTIVPGDTFEPATEYYVEVDGGSISDGAGVFYAGISSKTTLSFTVSNDPTPGVTQVTSSSADGSYGSGATLPIQVQFSETVFVAGIPSLLIQLDGKTKPLWYASGSGTNTLTFNYDVTPGDASADLAYAGTGALTRGGGSIRGSTGVNSDLSLPSPGAAGSLSANRNLQISALVLSVSGFSNSDGYYFGGEFDDEVAGFNIAGGGDTNGDGFEDFALSIVEYDRNATGGGFNVNGGATWLSYGQTGATRPTIDLAGFGSGDGYVISGEGGRRLGNQVTMGDINGDGLDELITADQQGYIVAVWGKASRSNISLSAGYNASDVFRMTHYQVSTHRAERLIDASGDFNGDGIDDLLVGDPLYDDGAADSGIVYLVLGRAGATRADVHLHDINGTNGFRIRATGVANQNLGSSVHFIGDYNGDGYDDILVGQEGADNTASNAGRSYVIFGKPGNSFANLAIGDINGSNGFAITSAAASGFLGAAVTGGDINGDALTDLIIAQEGLDQAVVLYGVAGQSSYSGINVDSLASSAGFRIQRSSLAARVCSSDFDSDGIDDIVVTDSTADSGRGSAWLIFGKAGTGRGAVDLDSLSASDGFRINGGAFGDAFGTDCAAADNNGDGYTDLLFSAPLADFNGNLDAGRYYVVWGRNFQGKAIPVQTGDQAANALVGSGGADTLDGRGAADSFSSGNGDDVLAAPDLSFAHINGGRGLDLLTLDGSSQTFDLITAGAHRLQGVEMIDLGNRSNTLQLTALDVHNISRQTSELYVTGGANDTVEDPITGGSWVAAGTQNVGGIDYNVYTLQSATLFVQTGIQQSGL